MIAECYLPGHRWTPIFLLVCSMREEEAVCLYYFETLFLNIAISHHLRSL